MSQCVWLPEMCSVLQWLILVVWVLRNWENKAKLVMLHLRQCFDEGFSPSVDISESVLKCLSSRSGDENSLRNKMHQNKSWHFRAGSWTCFGGCIPVVKEMHCVRMRGELLYDSLVERAFPSFILQAHQPAIRPSALLTRASPRWTARKEWDAASSFSSWPFCLDVAGLVLLLVGIFAPISFWDLLVLSGPIIIFLSLVFWIFWYLGNLTVPYRELLPKWAWTGGGIWTGEVE